MKKIFSFLAFLSLLSVFTIVKPASLYAYDCGDKTVSDGKHQICQGDIIEHQLSGVEIFLSYLNQANVRLQLFGVNGIEWLNLYKYDSYPKKVISDNNMEVSFKYEGMENELVSVSLTSKEVPSLICGDSSSGSEGIFNGCVGDAITYHAEGLKVKIRSYNDKRIKLALRGSKRGQILLTKGVPRDVLTENDEIITFTYLKNDDIKGAFVKIES